MCWGGGIHLPHHFHLELFLDGDIRQFRGFEWYYKSKSKKNNSEQKSDNLEPLFSCDKQ